MVEIVRNNCQWLMRAITLAAAASVALPSAGWAVPFNPQASLLSKPGNRRGAATRAGGEQCRADKDQRLTALVPRSNNGWTLSERPNLHWYMPSSSFKLARFDLYEVGEGEQHQAYSAEFPITGNAGVTSSVHLDPPLPPLTIGQSYRWVIVLVCPDQPSRNVFAEGWVQRVQPKAAVAAQLAAAAPEDRFKIYAEAGLWYDTLQELAQLRQAQPQESSLIQEWQELMASESVQLSEVPAQPFTQP